MSLGANGFVNGTTTISLPSVETASPRGGLGDFIYSETNSASNTTQTRPDSNPDVFSGGADRIALRKSLSFGAAMLGWLYSTASCDNPALLPGMDGLLNEDEAEDREKDCSWSGKVATIRQFRVSCMGRLRARWSSVRDDKGWFGKESMEILGG